MKKPTIIQFVIAIVILSIIALLLFEDVKTKNKQIEESKNKQEKIKIEEIFFSGHGSNEYGTVVYKFEYNDETYFVSNQGGIIRVENKE